MKQIHFFSAATVDYTFMLEALCLGMKKFKDPNYTYIYHVMLDTEEIDKYEYQMKVQETDTFKIDLMNPKDIIEKINQPRNRTMQYVRCLTPSLFPTLDRILWLDVDLMIVKPGIEALFEYDFGQKYGMACYDIPTTFSDKTQRDNTHVNLYFNTGVLMLNLKQLRQSGMDKILEQDMIEYPKEITNRIFDQTLLNYRFKENMIWLPIKYNNMIYGTTNWHLKTYQTFFEQMGYSNVLDSINDAIIVHFTNTLKPWLPPEEYAKEQGFFPFKKQAKEAFLKYVQILLNM